jgi:multiple sugar transport system permease protein/raffinose/stachyose/melibiose transport system permease protein
MTTAHLGDAARIGIRRRSSLSSDVWLSIVLGVLGFLTFVPVLMLLQLSVKTEQQMATHMWLPTWPMKFGNYQKALRIMVPYMINSLWFVVGTVSISLLFSILSGYAFGRYDFPGKAALFLGILGLMMIPGILTLLTRFVVVIDLKMNNTLWGIWLPMAAGSQAFQIIVLRTFFASLPEELFEAGRLDGASELRMLVTLAMPLAKPIITTLFVLLCNSVWNEFIWPIMVLRDPDRYPAILGILRLRDIMYGGRDPGAEFAGYVIAGLPLLLLFAFSSRAFIRGLTSGAVKM